MWWLKLGGDLITKHLIDDPLVLERFTELAGIGF